MLPNNENGTLSTCNIIYTDMGTNICAIVYFTRNGGNTENISTSSQHPIFSLMAVEFVESPSLEASHLSFICTHF